MTDLRFGIATGAYEHERDDWPAAIARAAREGWRTLELTAIRAERLEALVAHLADGAALEAFERVSVHAPVDDGADLDRLPAQFDAILHPNVYADATALGPRAVFENMDVCKRSGRTTGELEAVFARNPQAGFCLDVAHVWTNDPTLALGHELLDAFGPRLRQLHVSGIEADGTHRPTTAADLGLYEPLLARCGHVPWLLEAEPA